MKKMICLLLLLLGLAPIHGQTNIVKQLVKKTAVNGTRHAVTIGNLCGKNENHSSRIPATQKTMNLQGIHHGSSFLMKAVRDSVLKAQRIDSLRKALRIPPSNMAPKKRKKGKVPLTFNCVGEEQMQSRFLSYVKIESQGVETTDFSSFLVESCTSDDSLLSTDGI